MSLDALPDDASPVLLSSVIATGALFQRPSRLPDYEVESHALSALAQELSTSPQEILHKVAETARTLCRAHSAGVSLLSEEQGQTMFRWPAIAGEWSAHTGGTAPRDFSPFGVVLDRNAPQLFVRCDRYYSYFSALSRPLHETLLVPFDVDGEAVGTLWVVSHDDSRQFDTEDLRLLTSVGKFASAAVTVLSALEKRAAIERSLRESEERARLALDVAALGTWSWDLERDVLQADCRCREVCGFGADEPLSFANTKPRIHVDDWPRVEAAITAALLPDGPGRYAAECRFVDGRGGQRWVTARGQTRFEHRGGARRAVLMVGTVRDITERKSAEAAREAIKDRLTADLDVMNRLHELSTRLVHIAEFPAMLEEVLSATIALHGADFGNVHLYDPATDTLTIAAQRGFAQDFVDPFDVVDVADTPVWSRALKQRERVMIQDVEAEPGSARSGYRAVQSTPIFGRANQPLGVLSTYFRKPHRVPDETLRLTDLYMRLAAELIERKQDEERLRKSDAALREADRRKDEFLASLAHELRNPLAPLRNGLQIMRMATNNSELIERARGIMERQVEHLVRLIDDLLDVSRIGQGKVALRMERVDLATVVQSALETVRPIIEAKGHRLTIDAPREPIFVNADAVRLAQIFANLLNNAAKYTERNGHISLGVSRRDARIVVTVKDTGIGIPSELLDKVFGLFVQGDRSLESSQGGIGVGLTIAQRLVELHGGAIEARSEGYGRGSEFIVTLPAVLSVVDSHAGERRSQRIEPPRRLRILIVEDNRDSALAFTLMLQMMGHEVRSAHDGIQGVELAAMYRPEVIFLDIGIPRLNGYDAARRIRQQPWGRDTLLVALTGWGQEEDRKLSREAGFDHHVVKPVEISSLEKILDETTASSAGVYSG